ncbi:TetR/AcrR family transcriptional regulator [Niabella drilacis]|uniref:Transcriptional regulator, TetR family n=1 Tax=Niabella drilacis (strain DSM 25811 / CCM 8410 / CCUG 62505 / LMG 26954 / E90) TaxID=1285928 RepID=A0A1G6LB74_NIADE|nr:TetR/AcrR family transcriptional regulator [Niabella drilacis]SDC39975.1 transcriptional regulator, TetR family [Niabella drilacis]
MAKKKQQEALSSEEKIKEAARKVFMEKGYAATRTRDIAEAAGINLALLNYYFRSKEKLFELVMQEKLSSFFGLLLPVLRDPQSSLDDKIHTIADRYISMLADNPDLPLFVLNAMRNAPKKFAALLKGVDHVLDSAFAKQLKERNPDVAPEHLFINILSLCVFPFAMRPGLEVISPEIGTQFHVLMEERKKLVPKWMRAMLKVK